MRRKHWWHDEYRVADVVTVVLIVIQVAAWGVIFWAFNDALNNWRPAIEKILYGGCQ
jgi:hypothetical protein